MKGEKRKVKAGRWTMSTNKHSTDEEGTGKDISKVPPIGELQRRRSVGQGRCRGACATSSREVRPVVPALRSLKAAVGIAAVSPKGWVRIHVLGLLLISSSIDHDTNLKSLERRTSKLPQHQTQQPTKRVRARSGAELR